MNIIKISDENRQEVLVVLLKNGNFRSLDKNTFVIEKNAKEVIKKLKTRGINVF